MILGDLSYSNYSKIKWGTPHENLPKECRDFISILDKYNMTQYNFHPSTKDSNTLDLVIHNVQEKMSDVNFLSSEPATLLDRGGSGHFIR